MSKLEIPESWAEVSIDSSCDINPKNKDLEDDLEVGFIPMALVSEGGFIKGHEVRVWSKVKRGFTHFADDDVIFAKITPCMENKKSAIVTNMPNGLGCGSTEFHVLRSKGILLPKFLLGFLRRDLFIVNAEKNMTGSAGQKRVPTTWLAKQHIPVPPLGEQKRIIAKIEYIHEKIKTIEQSVTKAEELIGKYREALLQKAFRGKLIPQDPNDEPASKLLERIRADRVMQTGSKRKKKDDLPPINLEEIPFEIPKSWKWVRLGTCTLVVEYGSSAKTSDDTRGVPVLRMGNIQNGRLDITNLKYLPSSHDEFPQLFLKHKDLLFNRTNSPELVGKCAVFNTETEPCSFASYLIRVNLIEHVLDADYTSLFINSAFGREWVNSVMVQQVGQANVNGTKLKQCLIPLPPLNEQKRIMALLTRADVQQQIVLSTLSEIDAALETGKQSILNSAFSGKLVPQESSEGSGQELLAKIKKEHSLVVAPKAIQPSIKTSSKNETRTKK